MQKSLTSGLRRAPKLGRTKRICTAAAVSAAWASIASATTYTYTPTNNGTGPDNWSGGTASHWSAAPTSNIATTLTFVGSNTTVLASGLVDTNTNDIGSGSGSGNFLLTDLLLQGTGPASGGTVATININGLPLEIESGPSNAGTVSLNALAGSAGLIYNVNTNVQLDSANQPLTQFNGSGTATFDFNGILSGAGGIEKSGSSILTLTNADTFTGVTTITGGGVTLSGLGASVASSNVTAAGGTFTITNPATGTPATSFTRAKSLTLRNGTFILNGGAAGDTNDVITNALTVGIGADVMTLNPNSNFNSQLTAATLGNEVGGTLLIRGGFLGQAPIGSATAGVANVVFNTAPTLSGNGQTFTDTVGIVPFMIGDSSATGSGTDFVTYDPTDGLRLLTAAEYAFSFPSGDTTGVNANLSSALTGINDPTTINSLVLASGGSVAGTGSLTISSGAILSKGTTTSVSNPISVGSTPAILTATGSSVLTLGGGITGSAGLVKAGTGTATLGGAGTLSGPGVINNGTLNVSAANAMPTGALTIGTYTTAGTLNLTASQTVSSIDFLTTSSSVTNKVSIATGDTLTVNGAGSLKLGNTTNIDNATTFATFTGAGALAVSNTGGNFEVGIQNTNQNAPQNTAKLDLSALGSFSAAVGEFRVGYNSEIASTLLLSNTANSVTATTVQVSNSLTNNGQPGLITLGTGTNVINANTFNIGAGKGTGTLSFASQTAGSAGTATIGGNTTAATLILGDTIGTGTGGTPTGLLNLFGHNSTVSLGSLIMGKRDSSGTGGATGTVDFDTGTFAVSSIDAGDESNTANTGIGAAIFALNGGAFSVNSGGSFAMATATGAGTANGTLTINGDAFSVGSNGTINLAKVTNTTASANPHATATINLSAGSFTVASGGSFTLATASNSATGTGVGATAAAVLNLTGGTFTSGDSILKGGATGTGATATVTLTLNGATLDLQGNTLGNAAQPLDTLNFQAGTLQNLAEINGGTTALNKIAAGTLIMAGANAYSDGTLISSGTLLANSVDLVVGSTGLGTVTVSPAARLGGGTSAGPGQIRGNTTVAAGGIVSAGNAATSGTATTATLNIAGTTTLTEGDGTTGANAGSIYLWKLNNATGSAGQSSGWDLLTLNTLSLNPGNGSVVTVEPLTAGGGTVGGAVANFNPATNYAWAIATAAPGSFAAGANNVASNFMLDVPSLSTFAAANNATGNFALDVSNSGGELDVVYYAPAPEPGSLMLAALAGGALVIRRRRKTV